LPIEVLNDGGYSVTADGRQFVFARNAAESAARSLHLLFNWRLLARPGAQSPQN
jgi:hypothetical protein